ncbi:hypothetical protein ACFQ0B_77290 [Nonomuraea thailandensis]
MVKSPEGKVLWASKTHGNPQARLVVQNDGNTVLYSSDGEEGLWSTRTSR